MSSHVLSERYLGSRTDPSLPSYTKRAHLFLFVFLSVYSLVFPVSRASSVGPQSGGREGPALLPAPPPLPHRLSLGLKTKVNLRNRLERTGGWKKKRNSEKEEKKRGGRDGRMGNGFVPCRHAVRRCPSASAVVCVRVSRHGFQAGISAVPGK